MNAPLFSHVKISTLLRLHKTLATFASKLKRFGTLFSLNFASTKFGDFRDFEKVAKLILAKYRTRED